MTRRHTWKLHSQCVLLRAVKTAKKDNGGVNTCPQSIRPIRMHLAPSSDTELTVSSLSKGKYFPAMEAQIFNPQNLLSRNVKRTRVSSISFTDICLNNFLTLLGNDYDLNCK